MNRRQFIGTAATLAAAWGVRFTGILKEERAVCSVAKFDAILKLYYAPMMIEGLGFRRQVVLEGIRVRKPDAHIEGKRAVVPLGLERDPYAYPATRRGFLRRYT